MKLVSLDKVKRHLSLDGTNSEVDLLINDYIEEVSGDIENYLGRKLQKDQYTEYFNADKRRVFCLQSYPIDPEETITVTFSDDELTENEDYKVWYDKGIVEFNNEVVSFTPKDISISYTGGYDTYSGLIDTVSITMVPIPLQKACRLQVQYEYERRLDLGLTSLTLPDGSITKKETDDFLTQVLSILKRYRNTSK